MTEKNSKLTMNNKALWLLLAEYAPITVIGIENPYQGWLIEDIEADAEKNIRDLEDKGFLLIQPDGSYELLPELRLAVDLIAKPDTILITLDSSSGIFQEETYYYLGKQDCLRLLNKDEKVLLEQIADRSALPGILLNNLPLPQESTASIAFSLPQELLFQASALAVQANYAEILSLLDETNLTDIARNELMQALQDRQANASFAILKHPADPDKQRVSGFGILAGANRLWTLTPVNKPGKVLIEFSPTTPTQLRAELAVVL